MKLTDLITRLIAVKEAHGSNGNVFIKVGENAVRDITQVIIHIGDTYDNVPQKPEVINAHLILLD